MKTADILILAAAGAVAFFLLRPRGAASSSAGASKGGAVLVKEWLGWRYYSDGTAIDPLGNYYFQGAKVWDITAGAV